MGSNDFISLQQRQCLHHFAPKDQAIQEHNLLHTPLLALALAQDSLQLLQPCVVGSQL